jgi:hypothetical protein
MRLQDLRGRCGPAAQRRRFNSKGLCSCLPHCVGTSFLRQAVRPPAVHAEQTFVPLLTFSSLALSVPLLPTQSPFHFLPNFRLFLSIIRHSSQSSAISLNHPPFISIIRHSSQSSAIPLKYPPFLSMRCSAFLTNAFLSLRSAFPSSWFPLQNEYQRQKSTCVPS